MREMCGRSAPCRWRNTRRRTFSSNGDSIIEAYTTPRHGLYCYPLWHLLHPAEAVSVFWGISEYMKRAASGMKAAFNI